MKCRFLPLFQKNKGQTFTELRTKYRTGQSRKMLLTNCTLTDARVVGGFENLSYFSRTYKRLTGEHPTVIKKRWR